MLYKCAKSNTTHLTHTHTRNNAESSTKTCRPIKKCHVRYYTITDYSNIKENNKNNGVLAIMW